MKQDDGLVRNATTLVISSGVPDLPAGDVSTNFAAGPFIVSWRPSSVDITPGLTELILAPLVPHALAIDCTRSRLPRLENA